MSDRYLEFSKSALGKQLAGLLGLPSPPRLRRATGAYQDQPLAGRKVLVGGSPVSTLSDSILTAVTELGPELFISPNHVGLEPLKAAAAKQGVLLKGEPEGEGIAPEAIIFDGSGLASTADLRALYELLQPRVSRLAANGRIILISNAPGSCKDVGTRTASNALRGFVKSLGKEIGRKGSTVNLVEVEPGGEARLSGVLHFLLSEHSAFVAGQPITVGAGEAVPERRSQLLAGKRALVTGSARGIGEAISQTLAREGAEVIGMDRPEEEGALGEVMSRIGGRGLALDVTSADAAEQIMSECGSLDIIVHNAGVTRDKTLRNMKPHLWDMVLEINLGAIMRINEKLMDGGFNKGARVVCISSIGGIAGNPGQTNYGATKAGIIGYVDALSAPLAKKGMAINAVAPGFIETQMTAAMPLVNLEVGRRLNSLLQGGLPIDIAEAVTFFASPLSSGINGQTLRVCGQNFVGA